MDDDDKKQAQAARNKVYRLLKFRPRSVAEVRAKLIEKKFAQNIVEETIDYFKEYGFLDDKSFARGWIRSRLNRPFGTKRIHYELIQKGVDRDIIKEELDEALCQYCENDIVFDLAKRRMEKYRHLEIQKAKQRLIGYLNRRGFNQQAIIKAIKKIT